MMPWKNGGGTTAEIAIEPEGAALNADGFIWRLSLATIERAGPFSAFPGVDRTIMLIEGLGMTLTGNDGTTIVLDQRFRPQDFPGEWSVDCRLSAGPVRDLNLMVNRASAQAQWRVLELDGAAAALPATANGMLLVYVLQGYANCSGIEADPGVSRLVSGETLIADTTEIPAGASAAGDGTIFAAAIERRGTR